MCLIKLSWAHSVMALAHLARGRYLIAKSSQQSVKLQLANEPGFDRIRHGCTETKRWYDEVPTTWRLEVKIWTHSSRVLDASQVDLPNSWVHFRPFCSRGKVLFCVLVPENQ